MTNLNQPDCIVNFAPNSTGAERLKQMYVQYGKVSDLMAVLVLDSEYAAASNRLEALAHQIDDLMGVTPEARRAESLLEHDMNLKSVKLHRRVAKAA